MASRARRVVAAVVAVVLGATILVSADETAGVAIPVGGSPVKAAVASDWDPGYIIDDKVFYDASSYTSFDVQNFLNGKVSRCSAGYTCVKDYGSRTVSLPADRYCTGYAGVAWETAAQMIDKAARACGINHRVLLVMLQKEQGLITSTAPSQRMYDAAMGQGCPDTAPCDPATLGFAYQVYYAARQYQVYRLNPNSFGYRAQRWNNILYHPDSSRGCGTQRVFINNQATAALYIYTPYVPDAAALANLYGTGGNCSSYGNRNFWRLFSDWFGNPRSYEVHPGFMSYWLERGGPYGYMGVPVSYPVFVEENGQGWFQKFAGGTLFASYSGGAFLPNNSILREYERFGGPYGPLGFPHIERTCVARDACHQPMTAGSIASTPQYGAHVLWWGFNSYWGQSGGLDGSLGAAVTDLGVVEGPTGTGWVQNFEKAVVGQSDRGIYTVPWSIAGTWVGAGGPAGAYGWPIGAQTCSGASCVQPFDGAVLTNTARWGTHAVSGGFTAWWNAQGGVAGPGAALNDIRYVDVNGGGWIQNFEGGIGAQSRSGVVTRTPYGPLQAAWSAAGDITGWYGWPVTDQTCVGGACGQSFQGATLTTSPYGAFPVVGGLSAFWNTNGALGAFGPAVNNIRYSAANGGGFAQHFGSGVITQATGSGPVFTPYGSILQIWYYYGAEQTWLGWPTGPQTCDAAGCRQTFQNGVATSTPAGAVTFARP